MRWFVRWRRGPSSTAGQSSRRVSVVGWVKWADGAPRGLRRLLGHTWMTFSPVLWSVCFLGGTLSDVDLVPL